MKDCHFSDRFVIVAIKVRIVVVRELKARHSALASFKILGLGVESRIRFPRQFTHKNQ